MEHRKIVDANINRVDKKELEGLLNLLATTYVGRKNSLTEAKAAQLKEQFIALLNKKKDSTSKDTYEAMLRLIERFERVLHQELWMKLNMEILIARILFKNIEKH